MDIIQSLHNALHRTLTRFPLINQNPSFNPVMVQKPLIGIGNTGRYALEAQQIALNSSAGGGTLVGNSPSPVGTFIDVTVQQRPGLTGIGTIPNVPTTQGLVPGFRYNAL